MPCPRVGQWAELGGGGAVGSRDPAAVLHHLHIIDELFGVHVESLEGSRAPCGTGCATAMPSKMRQIL